MNILLSCAGRRGYMVEYFKQALRSAGLKGKVFAANNHYISTAMTIADEGYLTGSIYDEDYIDKLMAYAVKKEISLIVPLLDLELPVLAKAKKRFKKAGITIAISDEAVCNVSNDKWLTYSFLKKHGFSTAKCFLTLEDAEYAIKHKALHFPLFVKPRLGMGSIAVSRADDLDELKFVYSRTKLAIKKSCLKNISEVSGDKDVIIQEILTGTEYGLDVINDFNGKYATTFVKKKLSMRSGETDAATTVEEPLLVNLGKELSTRLKHAGILDCDVFLDGHKPYVLEMNPRFGGGYPFSHIAGADVPLFYVLQTQMNPNVDQKSILSITHNITGAKNPDPMIIQVK